MGAIEDAVASSSTSGVEKAKASAGEEDEDEEEEETEVVLSMEDLEEAAFKDYDAGGYSPPRITDPEKLIELQVNGLGDGVDNCHSKLSKTDE